MGLSRLVAYVPHQTGHTTHPGWAENGATCCAQLGMCRTQSCTIKSLVRPGAATDLPVPVAAAQSPLRPGWSWQKQPEGHKKHSACSSGNGFSAESLAQRMENCK